MLTTPTLLMSGFCCNSKCSLSQASWTSIKAKRSQWKMCHAEVTFSSIQEIAFMKMFGLLEFYFGNVAKYKRKYRHSDYSTNTWSIMSDSKQKMVYCFWVILIWCKKPLIVHHFHIYFMKWLGCRGLHHSSCSAVQVFVKKEWCPQAKVT